MSSTSILNEDELEILRLLEPYPLDRKLQILQTSILETTDSFEQSVYRAVMLRLQNSKAGAEVKL